MPGRGAPTFLKRQKEQKRAARALAKRVAKQARRDNRAAGGNSDPALDETNPGQTLDEEISAEQNEQDPGSDDRPSE
jgi:hypothetical protein